MRNPKLKEWLAKDYSQDYITDRKPSNLISDEGVRNSPYVSGCLFVCEGCFNKAAQNFRYSKPFTSELEEQIIAGLRNDYVQGLALLGGKPFLNTDTYLQVVRRIRKEFGTAKDIWSWTGYTFDELLQDSEDKLELLSQIDILIDGRFELSRHGLKLQLRGNSNQRIIDVQKSLESNQVVIWKKCTNATETYEQIKKQDLV